MKIGEFSNLFGLAPETVRYYVNKGLLVPVSKNERYDFDYVDVDDMRFLMKLKSFRFSLSEIHRIMSLRRLSNFDSRKELMDYIDILNHQKKNMLLEKKEIDSIINAIKHEIASATGKHNPVGKKKYGVPLVFLQYLACPKCQGELKISNCNIEKDHILSGDLTCTCGFKAEIKNGILIGDSGKISKYDWPDLERNCYRLMNPTLISYMHKAYHWMLEKLRQKNIKGKVVLEDFINNYCFCQMNFELMDKDALYIITDKYPEIVAVYKGLIDKLSLEHNIIYIASASNMLPLKFGCVDLYIDLDSANEYALYNNGYSTEALKNYFNKDSSALGLFFSFKPKSSSFAELHKQFPEAWEKSYDISYFRQHLRKTWRQVLAEEAIGKVTDSTQEEIAYSYHIPGEVGVDVYHVEGFLTERTNSDHKRAGVD